MGGKSECRFILRLKGVEDRKEERNVPLVEKLDTKPTVTPRMMDAQGGIIPDAGVAPTRPEIQPEHYCNKNSVFIPKNLPNHPVESLTQPTILRFLLSR
jgi:hypothetical protein